MFLSPVHLTFPRRNEHAVDEARGRKERQRQDQRTQVGRTDEEDGAIPNLKLRDNLGWAWQAGVDVPVSEHWYWNADVKKLYVGADTSFTGSPVRAKIDLNPWVVGTGIGYRF